VIDVSLLRVVETLRGPGRMPDTNAAAAIPARIWAMKHTIVRTSVRAPTR